MAQERSELQPRSAGRPALQPAACCPHCCGSTAEQRSAHVALAFFTSPTASCSRPSVWYGSGRLGDMRMTWEEGCRAGDGDAGTCVWQKGAGGQSPEMYKKVASHFPTSPPHSRPSAWQWPRGAAPWHTEGWLRPAARTRPPGCRAASHGAHLLSSCAWWDKLGAEAGLDQLLNSRRCLHACPVGS